MKRKWLVVVALLLIADTARGQSTTADAHRGRWHGTFPPTRWFSMSVLPGPIRLTTDSPTGS